MNMIHAANGAGWFLERVEVIDEATGTEHTFQCRRWLAKDEDDGKISRELSQCKSALNQKHTYSNAVLDAFSWL